MSRYRLKFFLCFSLASLFLFQLNAETTENSVSPDLVFHDIGRNMLNSVACNYGLNFIGAGLGTWGFIETGLDWKWRNAAYNNAWLANAGLPFLFSGYWLPVAVPISVYLAGRRLSDTKLQITAFALVQAFAITQAFHVPLKLITGRSIPGIISGVFFEPNNFRDNRRNDFSGEFNWFKFDLLDGWPSGHAACAFSAAAVIAEIYYDKPLLKAGVYAAAALMGFGVAVNAHWASDSVAGALLGYAVGKTVGKSFSRLLGKTKGTGDLAFYISPSTVVMNISLK
jgi:membrane-associated phospholipid phosphatase